MKQAILATPVRRRTFVKTGLFSGAMMTSLGAGALASDDEIGEEPDHDRTVVLEIHDVLLELIDGKQVFMYAFSLKDEQPTVPGPVIRIKPGLNVRFRVLNNSSRAHDFQILGMGPSMGLIPPGERGEVTLTASRSGTFMYVDPEKTPVNRVLGLHGIIVVDGAENATSNGKPMPYAAADAPPGSAVDALFGRLAQNPFPGKRWRHGAAREKVWVFNQVDERWCARARAGEDFSASDFMNDFRPRYFTMNGHSGYDAVHDPDCVPTGVIGDPLLLRCANAGLAWHSPHIHGNHVFEVASNYAKEGPSVPLSNVMEIDTWTMPPGSIGDYLLPFRKPPDIPAAKWPMTQERFPLAYPMHCHNEISQTSGGGSYPMGLVCDWVIESA
ncbi:cupredoxin domain-containing protein [Indioceanicola profundi]|uniref:hypothetical protein n=1 Tax=Indioceanicola profundi TaxID=2220096 RepID=UPI000E6AA989|nr:hypothetical protein [Indioceanicola profundi]